MSHGKYRKESNCLNCGFTVEKHYCSSCGQANLDLKENLWDFLSHSIAHYFHFDNKFFQTLVPLVTKPGKVTLDYLAGKRARYINPVSMYIFVSIVYFLVAYAPKKKEKVEPKHETEVLEKEKEQVGVIDSIVKPLSKAGMNGEKIASFTKGEVQKELTRKSFKLMSLQQQEEILKNLKAEHKTNPSDSMGDLIEDYEEIYIRNNDSSFERYLARQKTLPSDQQDNLIERYLAKRRIGIGEKSELIDEQLAHNRPKQYFLLMPLMALFIMLNFRKNHINYLDHLIFTIHGMTVFFLVSIVTSPLKFYVFKSNSIISGIISLGLICFVVWYMFNSLKVFYQRQNKAIIWKMIWIILLYGLSVTLTENILRNIIYYVGT